MKKYFVLDTNVLLFDPQAIFSFDDNYVILPIWVIEEMDKFKKNQDEVGRNARETSRLLDKLRKKGDITEGVELESGGILRVELGDDFENDIPSFMKKDTADSHILSVALALKSNGNKVVFVSRDSNLRIKADTLGVNAVDFESKKVHFEELYSGWRKVRMSGERIDRFNEENGMDAGDESYYPNEFVSMENERDPNHSSLGKFSSKRSNIYPLKYPKDGVWGIKPRNREQKFAFDLLLDPDIKIVTLVGKAGTGKTLLSLAAGLSQTADRDLYQRLIVTRPVHPMGKDLGYLPGELEEKLKPWMQPIFDNLELIIDPAGNSGYEELMNQKILEIEALTYIRGRSLPRAFLVVDEAQNLTPHEVKTVVTRVGEESKIVLTGDPYQIDHPYIDSSSNGLCYALERFKEEEISGHVTLTKGERSYLAELAADLL